jgi:hypothetical protein
MKNLLTISLTILMLLIATSAMAERGYNRGDHGHYSSKGDRIDRHLDRKGDRIQHRFEHKADRANARGRHYKADRMRYKGERINRHLDRKGDRIHDRHDRRHAYKHNRHWKCDSKHRHHDRHDHRHRVVYRNYNPYDTYFGVVINQPGLRLGWGWYD